MKFFTHLGVICLILSATKLSLAQDTIATAAGKASQGINVLRVAWQRQWSQHWLVSDSGELSAMHALSINRWSTGADSITAFAYSPVFIYHLHTAPLDYVKLGIGGAYLSDTQIKGRNLSSYFQFEDQVGVGWQWRKHDLSLVYMHYSNAGIKKPNQGIDMFLLSYAWRLD